MSETATLESPLSVSKLETNEDHFTHEGLQRLALADTIAAEIVIEGAIPASAEGWIRMEQFVRKHGDTGYNKREWAYYVGMAVGLRLARATTPSAVSSSQASDAARQSRNEEREPHSFDARSHQDTGACNLPCAMTVGKRLGRVIDLLGMAHAATGYAAAATAAPNGPSLFGSSQDALRVIGRTLIEVHEELYWAKQALREASVDSLPAPTQDEREAEVERIAGGGR